MKEQNYIEKVNSIIRVNETPYVLNEFLSSGGQGGIYQATNKQNGQVVALKWQTSMLANEEKVLNFFIKEQKQMKYNIRIYDMFKKSENQIYVVMEYANGGNLFEYLYANPQLPLEDKIFIMKQLAFGVKELHKLQLIHRDIKPENVVILMDDNGHKTYKFCDIGLIKMNTPDFVDTMGVNTGTPLFFAPEMIGSKDYDEKVDIWALGVLYLEILFGYSLFDGRYNIYKIAEDDDKIYLKIREFKQSSIKEQLQQIIGDSKTEMILSMLNLNPFYRIDINKVVQYFQPIIKSVTKPLSSNPRLEKKLNSILPMMKQQQLNTPLTIQINKQVEGPLYNEASINKNLQEQIIQKNSQLLLLDQQHILNLQQIFEVIYQTISEPQNSNSDLIITNLQLDQSVQPQFKSIMTKLLERNQTYEFRQQQDKHKIDSLMNQELQLKSEIQRLEDNMDQQQSEFKRKNDIILKTILEFIDRGISPYRNDSTIQNIEINEFCQQQIDRIVTKINNNDIMIMTQQSECDQMKHQIKIWETENHQYRQIMEQQKIELNQIRDELTKYKLQLQDNSKMSNKVDKSLNTSFSDMKVGINNINDNNGGLLSTKSQLNEKYFVFQGKLQQLIGIQHSQIINLNEIISNFDNEQSYQNQLRQIEANTKGQLQQQKISNQADLDYNISQLEQQLSENEIQIKLLSNRIQIVSRQIIEYSKQPKSKLIQEELQEPISSFSIKNSEYQSNQVGQNETLRHQQQVQSSDSQQVQKQQNVVDQSKLKNIITGVLYVVALAVICLFQLQFVVLKGTKRAS